MVTLSNGNLFTIGGSWSGGHGGKNGMKSFSSLVLLILIRNVGEIYNTSANIWTVIPGAPVAPMLV